VPLLLVQPLDKREVPTGNPIVSRKDVIRAYPIRSLSRCFGIRGRLTPVKYLLLQIPPGKRFSLLPRYAPSSLRGRPAQTYFQMNNLTSMKLVYNANNNRTYRCISVTHYLPGRITFINHQYRFSGTRINMIDSDQILPSGFTVNVQSIHLLL